MLTNAQRIYSLADYTVERKRNGWHFSRTSRFGDKHESKGPYGSLASVTLMIARELKREIAKRDAPYSIEETHA